MANNSDVTLTIGAKTNIADAQNKIIAEFKVLENRLRKVGTQEAEELQKEISAIISGLGSGKIEAKDVEAVAVEFAKVAKNAELSDKNISDLSEKISDAKNNSRKLSDYMRETSNKQSQTNKMYGVVKDWLDQMSPLGSKINTTIDGLNSKLGGAQGKFGKILGLAKGLNIAVLAVSAVWSGIWQKIRSANTAIREFTETKEKWRDEDIVKRATRREYAIDIEERNQAEKIRNEREAQEIQNQINAQRRSNTHKEIWERAKASGNLNADIEDIISENDRKFGVVEAETAIAEENEQTDRENKALTVESEALQKRINSKQQQLKDLEDAQSSDKEMQNVYNEFRSSQQKFYEDKANQGKKMTFGDLFEGGQNSIVAAWGEDLRKKAQEIFGSSGLSIEEAQQKYDKYLESTRQRADQIASLAHEIKGLTQDKVNKDAQIENNKSKKELNEEKLKSIRLENEVEVKKRQTAAERAVSGQAFSAMANSNRLTAMGLGGGNVAADATKDIAQNTKESARLLAQIQKGLAGGMGGKKLTTEGPRALAGTPPATWGMR